MTTVAELRVESIVIPPAELRKRIASLRDCFRRIQDDAANGYTSDAALDAGQGVRDAERLLKDLAG